MDEAPKPPRLGWLHWSGVASLALGENLLFNLLGLDVVWGTLAPAGSTLALAAFTGWRERRRWAKHAAARKRAVDFIRDQQRATPGRALKHATGRR